MTRDDIIKLAQECQLIGMRPHLDGIYQDSLERFANLVAAAERNILAAWMIQRSYATGHGDTTEDLLKELEWQIAENWTNALVKGVEGEREACCDLLEGMHVAGTGSHNYYLHAATELRRLRNARSTT